MKKFRFRLEALLKFRKTQEEQAQIKLAEATSRLQGEQELLGELQNKLVANFALLSRRQQAGSSTIEALKTCSYYIDKIKRDITIQEEQVAKATAYRQECLEELTTAAKQRKLVASLRDKRLDQYYSELLQEEQKILDELGTQVFIRDKESVL
ncbi:hypothetical protein SCACP_16120 [Sporomusa carbonis]|uniref:flagellar export protein FliJ n=1 Tax=Sporomusa carbonis TaxID=3076075 RepID=UPI003A6FC75C